MNEQFKETLKEKMYLFNENPDCSSEEVIIERKKLIKQKEELLLQSSNYNSDVLDNRVKIDILTQDNSKFYEEFKKRHKKKCSIF